MKHIEIAVGSNNPVKVGATLLGFKAMWPEHIYTVKPFKFKSAVSAQPMSDSETIEGALYRADRALLRCKSATYGVGLEGGSHKIGLDWFETGWCVVVDHSGNYGISSSIRMKIPEKVMQWLNLHGGEVGDAMDSIFKKKNIKQKQGFFGLMTENRITRTSAYADAVISALSRFVYPKLF